MTRAPVIAVCFLALLGASCARRPTAARIVFAPAAAPPASGGSAEADGALVVAEPQASEPETEPIPPTPELTDRPRMRPRVRLSLPDPATEPESPPVADMPTLEPREGTAAQAAQRQQIVNFLDQVRARIARQDTPGLSGDERRMLGDARTFLAQSERALAASDFQRASTLARKASMLLAVIEQQ